MSFRITNLHIARFRTFEERHFTFDETLTILWGCNAVGKTSAIEAIGLLSEGSSFRRSPAEELIRHGQTDAVLELEASDTTHDPPRRRTVRAHIESGKKTYTVNNKPTSTSAGIVGVMPVVTFTPDNLRLIKDAAQRRREEVDTLGKQLSRNYARLGREYAKTLKGRNRLLADGYSGDPAFEAWTEQLAHIGAALYQHRAKLIERLEARIKEHYARIDPSTTLAMTYLTNWEDDAATTKEELATRLMEALQQSRADEVARKTTVVGPHRDDVVFTLDEHDARAFASQGQQRTIALAFKLAGADVIEEVTAKRPILLLDDVMSELDEQRRAALMAQVGKGRQTIITTTNTHYFEPSLLARALLVEIAPQEGSPKSEQRDA